MIVSGQRMWSSNLRKEMVAHFLSNTDRMTMNNELQPNRQTLKEFCNAKIPHWLSVGTEHLKPQLYKDKRNLMRTHAPLGSNTKLNPFQLQVRVDVRTAINLIIQVFFIFITSSYFPRVRHFQPSISSIWSLQFVITLVVIFKHWHISAKMI